MEIEEPVTRSIIDEIDSSDLVKCKVKVVLLEVSLMNFILRLSKDIKINLKEALLEVSLMNFILRTFNEIKLTVKVV